MPEALGRLNFIFFDDDAQFDDSLKQLCEALATDIAWIRKHTEYGEAARHWAASGRPAGLLLRSPVLGEAERWIASRPTARKGREATGALTPRRRAIMKMLRGLSDFGWTSRVVGVRQIPEFENSRAPFQHWPDMKGGRNAKRGI